MHRPNDRWTARELSLALLLALSLAEGCAKSHGLPSGDGGIVDAPLDANPRIDMCLPDLRPCLPGDLGPDSPCTDSSVIAEPLSIDPSGSGADAPAITQACVSAEGWGDCLGGRVGVELLNAEGARLGQVNIAFEDEGGSVQERACDYITATVPAMVFPCRFEGVFDLSGEACGGTSSAYRLCGDLAVDAGAASFQASVALDVWSVGICF